ncbi:MAG: CocE/NonD family hydrolase [bacterium]
MDWQVPIRMEDGIVLRADVFRPIREGRYPVILTYGPYAKGAAFQEVYPVQWELMVAEFPEVARGSTCKYQNWEVVDPEKWVPDGYSVVRVDSRGSGWSPGLLDVFSPRETKDLRDCIEWAAAQSWSNGKVGLCGISYYAINAWQVAGLQPPHLSAMIPWEGVADLYRDACYHGGILCCFAALWYPGEVLPMQYGRGERSCRNPNTGEPVAGPVTLTDEELAASRVDVFSVVKGRPLDDAWYRSRSADWSKIRVPFLSAANWGGQGLHSRGNFEAFMNAASEQKWLEVHGLEHWALFYTDYGLSLQKRFFGHFLKGEDTGWAQQPRVLLQVRHVDGGFTERHENEWPLARTQWTRYYLESSQLQLLLTRPALEGAVDYDPAGEGVTFWTAPVEVTTEITGPIAAKLFVSSSTQDADLFVVVRVFDPDGKEVLLRGALDPNTPIAQGWLRASHRELDIDRSRPYRPHHKHEKIAPLRPGEIYELDVEIWPTCLVIPAGYRIAFTIRGRDYECGREPAGTARRLPYPTTGCGPCLHVDPGDHRSNPRNTRVTVHTGGENASYLLLPVVPEPRRGLFDRG